MFHPLSQPQPIVCSLIKHFFGGWLLCLPGEFPRLQRPFSTIMCSQVHALTNGACGYCSALLQFHHVGPSLQTIPSPLGTDASIPPAIAPTQRDAGEWPCTRILDPAERRIGKSECEWGVPGTYAETRCFPPVVTAGSEVVPVVWTEFPRR